MADIVIPGEISGRRYGFTISGAEPTIDERKRIDAILRQQEGTFAKITSRSTGSLLLPVKVRGSLIALVNLVKASWAALSAHWRMCHLVPLHSSHKI
jgi:hypothetical protein